LYITVYPYLCLSIMSQHAGVWIKFHFLCTRWTSMISFMLWLLYPCRKSTRYEVDRCLGDKRTGLHMVAKRNFSVSLEGI